MERRGSRESWGDPSGLGYEDAQEGAPTDLGKSLNTQAACRVRPWGGGQAVATWRAGHTSLPPPLAKDPQCHFLCGQPSLDSCPAH